MHFRPGEVEGLGDEGHGRARHAAERRLNVVKDRQQRAFAAVMAADDLGGLRFAPGRHGGMLRGYWPSRRSLKEFALRAGLAQ